MDEPDLDIREKVIVRGSLYAKGHRLAWRRGVILAVPRPGLVHVRLERRGLERKRPEDLFPVHWLADRTPLLEARLREAGVLDGKDDAGEGEPHEAK